MKHLKERFDELVIKKPDNFIIIFFNAGMGGSSLLRILISHNELYHSFKNLSQFEYDDPLRYPDTIEGFKVHVDHPLSFKEQHLACAHIDFHAPWDDNENYLEYFKLVKDNKKIVIKTHNFSLYKKFKKCTCIFVVTDEPLDRGLRVANNQNPTFLPDEVIYVNINNLMSKDYEKFLEEYLSIVYKLNLTPRINSVRAFILMWLERQERFKRSLS